MTEALLESLRGQLRMMEQVRRASIANNCDAHTEVNQWRYFGVEALLLAEGRVFPPSAKRSPIERVARACFHQAYRLATRKGSKWLYCEGYAVSGSTGLAVHHAWVTPRSNPGDAYELAWPEDFGDAAYLGIAFDADFVRRMHVASERSTYGVLGAWWVDCPLLSGAVALNDVRVGIM
jgi:hypothetical protein